MKLRIGSRASTLAMAQTQWVAQRLQEQDPSLHIEIVPFTTKGDRILDRTLDKIGGKGLFVQELEQALRQGDIQLTVHSLKDMPMEEDPDLPILAYSPRENPLDVLVLPQDCTTLSPTKAIGTASHRRAVQLQALYPQSSVQPVRGNVLTRLEKLDRGDYSALVLAYAGLQRLGLEHRISRTFLPHELLPAGGQGVLAIQGTTSFPVEKLACLHDPVSAQIAKGERAFLRALGGGCSSPMACYGTIDQSLLTLEGMILHPEGYPLRHRIIGQPEDSLSLGKTLAEEIQSLGGLER